MRMPEDVREPSIAPEPVPDLEADVAPELSIAPVISIVPEPILRSVKRRRAEPVPGRRARRGHTPKRRRERKAGLIPAIIMLVGGLSLAVPWYLPGFGGAMHSIGSSISELPHGIGVGFRNLAGGIDTLFANDPPAAAHDPAVLATEPSSTPSTTTVRAYVPGVPQSVQVPRLQVSSSVVAISGDSGSLLPPQDPQKIGWWMQGPKPGSAAGTAVLTGHTVHTGGGAFDHLSFLKIGDHFTVTTDHGAIRYVITGLHKYETGALARQAREIFRLDGPPRVLLVTCSGWNGHIYLENTVVTGAPE